jgi:hypothetical protein
VDGLFHLFWGGADHNPFCKRGGRPLEVEVRVCVFRAFARGAGRVAVVVTVIRCLLALWVLSGFGMVLARAWGRCWCLGPGWGLWWVWFWKQCGCGGVLLDIACQQVCIVALSLLPSLVRLLFLFIHQPGNARLQLLEEGP